MKMAKFGMKILKMANIHQEAGPMLENEVASLNFFFLKNVWI